MTPMAPSTPSQERMDFHTHRHRSATKWPASPAPPSWRCWGALHGCSQRRHNDDVDIRPSKPLSVTSPRRHQHTVTRRHLGARPPTCLARSKRLRHFESAHRGAHRDTTGCSSPLLPGEQPWCAVRGRCRIWDRGRRRSRVEPRHADGHRRAESRLVGGRGRRTPDVVASVASDAAHRLPAHVPGTPRGQ